MEQAFNAAQPEVMVADSVHTQDGVSIPVYCYTPPVMNFYPPLPEGLLPQASSQLPLSVESGRLLTQHLQPASQMKLLQTPVNARSEHSEPVLLPLSRVLRKAEKNETLESITMLEAAREQQNIKAADRPSYYIPKPQYANEYKLKGQIVYKPMSHISQTPQPSVVFSAAARKSIPSISVSQPVPEVPPVKQAEPLIKPRSPQAAPHQDNETGKSGTLPRIVPGQQPSAPSCYWKEMWHKLNKMRTSGHLCDISLFSEDNCKFMGHSPVLAASSDQLHAYFINHSVQGIKELGEREILIQGISGVALKVTMDFIYGIFPTDQKDLECLMRGAEVLGIKGAVGFVQHVKRIDSSSMSRCPVLNRKTAENEKQHREQRKLSQPDEQTKQQSSVAPPPSAVLNYSMKSQPSTVSSDVSTQVGACGAAPRGRMPIDPHELRDMTAEPPPECPMHKLLRKDAAASMNDLNTIKKRASGSNDDNLLQILDDGSSAQKCPFGYTKDMNALGQNELLTEIALQDLYPELDEKKSPTKPPKNRARKSSESSRSKNGSLSKVKHKRSFQSHTRETRSVKRARLISGMEEATGDSSSGDKTEGQTALVKDTLLDDSDGDLDEEDTSNDAEDDDAPGSGTEVNVAIIDVLNDEHTAEADVKKERRAKKLHENVKDEMSAEARAKVPASSFAPLTFPVDEAALGEMNEIIKKLEKTKGVAGTGKSKYKCLAPGCPYSNRVLDFVLSHMHRRHGIGRPARRCPLCDHAYFSESQLRNHLRRAHDEKSGDKKLAGDKMAEFLCQSCGQTFRSKQTLHMHQLKVHQKGAIYSCEDCEFKTPRKKDMQVHLLSRHDKLVPGVQVYVCKYCPYKCLDRGRYDEHEAKHTGIQKFLCPICGKAYTTRRGMKTHVAYHQEDRPHKCTICNAGFKVRGKLNDHMKLMHLKVGEKPYRCGYCKHQTALRGNCNQHIKKYHPGLPICVIDTHAEKRQPVQPYYYKNYDGPNIEVRKDASSSCYASIGGAPAVKVAEIANEELPIANKDVLADLPDEPNIAPTEKVMDALPDEPSTAPSNQAMLTGVLDKLDANEVPPPLAKVVASYPNVSASEAAYKSTVVMPSMPLVNDGMLIDPNLSTLGQAGLHQDTLLVPTNSAASSLPPNQIHPTATDHMTSIATSNASLQKCPFNPPTSAMSDLTSVDPGVSSKCPYSMADLTLLTPASDGGTYTEIDNLKAL